MSRDVPEWIGRDDNDPVPPRVRMRVLLAHGRICAAMIGTKPEEIPTSEAA